MGTLRLLSDEFELCGLPWNLEVLPQGHILDATEKGRFMSCYLKLLDVKLLPADELPYVRFEITLVNRGDPKRNFTRVFENQYGQHPNATWGVPTYLELSKLQAMREEFMPDGDLKIQVKIKKCVKARDAAARRKCSVAEVLQKASTSGREPSRACMNEQITEWLQGDRSRLRADAVVVCSAISRDKMLSRRICRYIDGQRAECRSTTKAECRGDPGAGSPQASPGASFDDAAMSAALGPALVKLRGVMAHKPAMRKLLAHFGGNRPHAAVASCLAVDPAGLERHISDAVGPQEGAAAASCATRRRSMQERWRAVIFGRASPAGRFFSSSKHA